MLSEAKKALHDFSHRLLNASNYKSQKFLGDQTGMEFLSQYFNYAEAFATNPLSSRTKLIPDVVIELLSDLDLGFYFDSTQTTQEIIDGRNIPLNTLLGYMNHLPNIFKEQFKNEFMNLIGRLKEAIKAENSATSAPIPRPS